MVLKPGDLVVMQETSLLSHDGSDLDLKLAFLMLQNQPDDDKDLNVWSDYQVDDITLFTRKDVACVITVTHDSWIGLLIKGRIAWIKKEHAQSLKAISVNTTQDSV